MTLFVLCLDIEALFVNKAGCAQSQKVDRDRKPNYPVGVMSRLASTEFLRP